MTYATYAELETSFAAEELHPADFKLAVESYINKLLEPIRAEFATPELQYVYATQFPRHNSVAHSLFQFQSLE